MAKASVYNLYASTCLGGWENTHLASGAPEAAEAGGAPVFTEDNSASLDGSAAQMYCGGFAGDISENTVPKKILVKFSWAVEYDSPSVEVPNPETDISESDASINPQNIEIPEVIEELTPFSEETSPEPSPGPIESTEPEPGVSFLSFFVSTAHAQDASPTTTSEDAAITPASSYGLVEVLYTLDSVDWRSLGFVEKDEFGSKYFEIPIEEASDWEGISKIQVGIKSMPIVDGVVPRIYLDSVWIETEYEHENDDEIASQPANVMDAIPESGQQLDDEGFLAEDVSPEDALLDEALEPIVSLPSLSVRTLSKDIIIDSNATHSCEATPFKIDVSGRHSFSTEVELVRSFEREYEAEIGSLPSGIDVRFFENGDYVYELDSDDKTLPLLVNNEDGSRKGNFTIPVIFTEKGSQSSSVICQINVVNL